MTKLKLFVADCLYEGSLKEIKESILLNGEVGYKKQVTRIYKQHYANFGSYTRYFNLDRWSVTEILANSLETQNLWRKDNKRIRNHPLFWRISYQFNRNPFLRFLAPYFSPIHRTLIQQVELLAPDVVILTDLHLYPSSVLKKLKSKNLLLVGHVSSQIHTQTPLYKYDLLLSSIDKYLQFFKEMGIESFKFLPAFDRGCLPKDFVERDIDCVFVGSLYQGTPALLFEVKKYVPQIQIYGPALTAEMKALGLEENYQGSVYGNEMYEILARAKLVINRHGNPISTYGNVRTFEATGMGAALLTEENPDLGTIFLPDEEVFTYKSIENIGAKAKSILDSPVNLAKVSKSGQERTLADHTYEIRYKDLAAKLSSLLVKAGIE